MTRIYLPAEVAGFRFTKGPFGPLSNMHPDYPLAVPTARGMVLLDSSETLYQCLKFPDHPEVQAAIIAAGDPKGGKQVARAARAPLRSDWDGPGRITAMRLSIRLKTAQHRDRILAEIAGANGRPIVEISRRDAFWGAVPRPDGLLEGENVLGRLWMELEHDLQLDPEAFAETVSAPGRGHRLLGAAILDWRRTRTLNAHHVGTERENAVYVGRPSEWGNPCKITEGSRDSAITGYLDHLKDNPDLVEKIRVDLMGKDVICWCAPKDCHGDIIRHVAGGHPVPEAWPLKHEIDRRKEHAELDAQVAMEF